MLAKRNIINILKVTNSCLFSKSNLCVSLSVSQGETNFENKVPKKKNKNILNSKYHLDELKHNNLNFINDLANNNFKKHKKTLLAVENLILINDLIKSGYPKLLKIYWSNPEKVKNLYNYEKLIDNVKFFRVYHDNLKKFSDLITSQGIVAIFERPNLKTLYEYNLKRNNKKYPIYVIADQIRDPKNLGSLIRSCAGCGIEKLILMNGCADLFERKAVRSSCGSVFKLPILDNIEWSNISSELPSLTNAQIFLADSNLKSNILNDDDKTRKIYLEANFFEQDKTFIILIIGGEIGLSEESILFSKNQNGFTLSIPLENDVDSLNLSTAASILMYEMQRCFLIKNSQI